MITIIDYGMGNVGSIANMLKKVGAASAVTQDPQVIASAGKLILPGVGAFDNAMTRLDDLGITQAVREAASRRSTWLLGICLGMQLLGDDSEEGKRNGLGLVSANTVRFRFPSPEQNLRVPHMGWNQVTPSEDSLLLKHEDPEEQRFYFVHSYHVVCRNPDDAAGTTEYGMPFTSAVQHDRVMGVQFHPEKSHKFGMQLLKRYAELPI